MSLRVFLICVVLTSAASLRSEILNFGFSGIILDAGFSIDPSVTNGTPFTGFYSFDTAAADSNADPAVGDYVYTSSACGVAVKVGNYVFRTNPDRVDFIIETTDRPNFDAYLFISYANVASGGAWVESIEWQIDDYSGTAWTNDSLPVVPPNLSAFPSHNYISISGGFDLSGPVQSISVSPMMLANPPPVTIYPAVEVSWPSVMGYFYQVQESTNLLTWSDRGRPILSTGDPIAIFARQQPANTGFRLIIGPGSLGGAFLNFSFNGTITDADVAESPLDASVTNGTPFTGFYTFDPAVADSNPNPAVGDYDYTNSACGVAIKVGNYVFRTYPNGVDFTIETTDLPNFDAYLFNSSANVASGGARVESIEWQIDDYSGTAWTNDSLPVVPPNLSAFPSHNSISISGGNFDLSGAVQSISVNPMMVTNPPPPTIYPAVEVSWPSVMGYFYQVQESTNLLTWSDRGRPILGTGDPITIFARQEPANTFFRLIISNHGE